MPPCNELHKTDWTFEIRKILSSRVMNNYWRVCYKLVAEQFFQNRK